MTEIISTASYSPPAAPGHASRLNEESGIARRAAIPPVRAQLYLTPAFLVGTCVATDFLAIGVCGQLVNLVYTLLISSHGSYFSDLAVVAWLASVLFVTFQWLSGSYSVQSYLARTAGCWHSLFNWLLVTIAVATVAWLIAGKLVLSVMTIHLVAGAFTIVMVRAGTGRMLRAGLASGSIALRKAYLIYVGDDPSPAEVLHEAQKNGIAIAGISEVRGDNFTRRTFARACADLASQLRKRIQSAPFDEVYVFCAWESRQRLSQIATALENVPLPVFLFADGEMERLLQAPAVQFGRFKGFEVRRAPLSRAELVLKRALDVGIALTGIILLAPLLIAVSFAIFLTSGGPVIFCQERQGFCGRKFTIYKFRTMRVCEDGPAVTQAKLNDPRVTSLGSILRRSSIDELPQLFNVLKGDMSIVGPRPHAVAHDEHYSRLIAYYSHRQNVKPGITGWAQLHGLRGETKELERMSNRVSFDIWYINNWSIYLDLKIIIKTAIGIVFERRAY